MRLTLAALQDLDDASRWYDRAQPGLGDELLAAFDAGLDVLASNRSDKHPMTRYRPPNSAQEPTLASLRAAQRPIRWADGLEAA